MVAETHAMTIRLSGNVYEGLRNAAFVKRTSMTALIEEALRGHLPTFIVEDAAQVPAGVNRERR